MSDLISRRVAIDALDKHIDTFDVIDTNYLCGIRTAMSILKEMPSAHLGGEPPECLWKENLYRQTFDRSKYER